MPHDLKGVLMASAAVLGAFCAAVHAQSEPGLAEMRDDVEAAAWIRMAAEAGHPDAQFLLGLMYSEGRGVFHDQVLACMWHILAAQRSHDWNREVYADVLKLQTELLTPTEVREARRLAREWSAKHAPTGEDGQGR